MRDAERFFAEGKEIAKLYGPLRYVARAEAMVRGELRVADRYLRGLYLSCLRSALFNAVLARRVQDHNWDRALAGEALNLDGSRSFFVAEVVDDVILHRLAVTATGALSVLA